MIFLTLGSQKFQFNRLLKLVDKLIEEKIIEEEVFAQIGYSSYIPQNFKYQHFVSRDSFIKLITDCDFMITHGGTGAIITGLNKGKKVIAMPRIHKFKEHVDDHQLQIVDEFQRLNLISAAQNEEGLIQAIKLIENKNFNKYHSSTMEIIKAIEVFIETN